MVIKRSATVAHLINHHLVVVAVTPNHSVVRISMDQMLEPIQTHIIINTIDQNNLFSRNNVNKLNNELMLDIRRQLFYNYNENILK